MRRPFEMNLSQSGWLRSVVFVFPLVLMSAQGFAEPGTLELSQAQAIGRVRSILNNNAGPCRISQTRSVTAVRVNAGWRVTARIMMSGSAENAIWIVSSAGGPAPQNQLTVEIENGCP